METRIAERDGHVLTVLSWHIGCDLRVVVDEVYLVLKGRQVELLYAYLNNWPGGRIHHDYGWLAVRYPRVESMYECRIVIHKMVKLDAEIWLTTAEWRQLRQIVFDLLKRENRIGENTWGTL